MKLKLVVASMSLLGLISSPVFAAPQHKHKTHHKKVHHRMAKHECRDVRAMVAAAPAPMIQPAPVMEAAPRFDCNLLAMDAMTQNWNRGHAMADWFQRIGINGGINFDAHFGNRDQGYTTENYTQFSVNDVYLNTSALVNDWTRAFASISYNNASPGDENFYVLQARKHFGEYSHAYRSGYLNLEQGYITFGNFDCSPFFVQLGKMYQDYGRYNIHPLTRTLAQSLSETLRTSAKLGFMQNGFHGSVFVFENPSVKATTDVNGFVTSIDTRQEAIWGASVGFDQISDCLGFDVGVAYLSNMLGVNDVQRGVNEYEFATSSLTPPFVPVSGVFENRVGSVAAYADVNSGPFTFGVRYATALTSFNAYDLSTNFWDATANGAKPRALDLTAGYGWNCWDRAQSVFVSYQTTRDSVNLFLPRDRWALGYGIELWRNASVGFEWDHDKDYDNGVGGTGNTSNLYGVRAAVRFG